MALEEFEKYEFTWDLTIERNYLRKSEPSLKHCWNHFWKSKRGDIWDYWENLRNLSRRNNWNIDEIVFVLIVVWELTVLRLPPGFQAVGSEGCHHILNAVAVGANELIVRPSGIAFKTLLVFLKMDRDRDADVSGACETYRVFWGLAEWKTHSCGQQESRCSGCAPVIITL